MSHVIRQRLFHACYTCLTASRRISSGISATNSAPAKRFYASTPPTKQQILTIYNRLLASKIPYQSNKSIISSNALKGIRFDALAALRPSISTQPQLAMDMHRIPSIKRRTAPLFSQAMGLIRSFKLTLRRNPLAHSNHRLFSRISRSAHGTLHGLVPFLGFTCHMTITQHFPYIHIHVDGGDGSSGTTDDNNHENTPRPDPTSKIIQSWILYLAKIALGVIVAFALLEVASTYWLIKSVMRTPFDFIHSIGIDLPSQGASGAILSPYESSSMSILDRLQHKMSTMWFINNIDNHITQVLTDEYYRQDLLTAFTQQYSRISGYLQYFYYLGNVSAETNQVRSSLLSAQHGDNIGMLISEIFEQIIDIDPELERNEFFDDLFPTDDEDSMSSYRFHKYSRRQHCPPHYFNPIYVDVDRAMHSFDSKYDLYRQLFSLNFLRAFVYPLYHATISVPAGHPEAPVVLDETVRHQLLDPLDVRRSADEISHISNQTFLSFPFGKYCVNSLYGETHVDAFYQELATEPFSAKVDLPQIDKSVQEQPSLADSEQHNGQPQQLPLDQPGQPPNRPRYREKSQIDPTAAESRRAPIHSPSRDIQTQPSAQEAELIQFYGSSLTAVDPEAMPDSITVTNPLQDFILSPEYLAYHKNNLRNTSFARRLTGLLLHNDYIMQYPNTVPLYGTTSDADEVPSPYPFQAHEPFDVPKHLDHLYPHSATTPGSRQLSLLMHLIDRCTGQVLYEIARNQYGLYHNRLYHDVFKHVAKYHHHPMSSLLGAIQLDHRIDITSVFPSQNTEFNWKNIRSLDDLLQYGAELPRSDTQFGLEDYLEALLDRQNPLGLRQQLFPSNIPQFSSTFEKLQWNNGLKRLAEKMLDAEQRYHIIDGIKRGVFSPLELHAQVESDEDDEGYDDDLDDVQAEFRQSQSFYRDLHQDPTFHIGDDDDDDDDSSLFDFDPKKALAKFDLRDGSVKQPPKQQGGHKHAGDNNDDDDDFDMPLIPPVSQSAKQQIARFAARPTNDDDYGDDDDDDYDDDYDDEGFYDDFYDDEDDDDGYSAPLKYTQQYFLNDRYEDPSTTRSNTSSRPDNNSNSLVSSAATALKGAQAIWKKW